jgi:flagellar protein FliO/FliZ
MLETLFASETPMAIRFLLPFLIVLGVIGAAGWAMRQFNIARLAGIKSHGRLPRLAVLDSIDVSRSRRLVLIRRDSVEHLLLIDGPTDVVIETNVVNAAVTPREMAPATSPATAQPLPRVLRRQDKGSVPLLAQGSATTAHPMPEIERSPEQLPVRHSDAEKSARSQRDALAALAKELSAGLPAEPENPAAMTALFPTRPRPHFLSEPRGETRDESRAAQPPPETQTATARQVAQSIPVADEGLLDMARKLEAALSRSKIAQSAERTSSVEAAPPLPSPLTDAASSEPNPPPVETKRDSSGIPHRGLEQEMASLLGRLTRN